MAMRKIPKSKLKLDKTNPTWVVRSKNGKYKRIPNYDLKTAVAAQCTECIGYEEEAVKECSSPYCPLYPFRAFLEGGLAGGSTHDPRLPKPKVKPKAKAKAKPKKE